MNYASTANIEEVMKFFLGDKTFETDFNNYGLISLLSVFDKLLDKVMYNSLNAFLTKHKIFCKYHFGFRKNHATADALSEVTDFIYKSLDEGNFLFGIYVDLKRHSIPYSIEHYYINFNTTEIED